VTLNSQKMPRFDGSATSIFTPPLRTFNRHLVKIRGESHNSH
jgi:hypothetical protein